MLTLKISVSQLLLMTLESIGSAIAFQPIQLSSNLHLCRLTTTTSLSVHFYDNIKVIFSVSVTNKKLVISVSCPRMAMETHFHSYFNGQKIVKLRQSCDSFCVHNMQETTFVCTIATDNFCLHYCY